MKKNYKENSKTLLKGIKNNLNKCRDIIYSHVGRR